MYSFFTKIKQIECVLRRFASDGRANKHTLRRQRTFCVASRNARIRQERPHRNTGFHSMPSKRKNVTHMIQSTASICKTHRRRLCCALVSDRILFTLTYHRKTIAKKKYLYEQNSIHKCSKKERLEIDRYLSNRVPREKKYFPRRKTLSTEYNLSKEIIFMLK